ncbi:DUF4398 domain-containing protein [Marinobacter sp. 71-i]|uniref:DUF4398 domain-containing protein n=1 Tax=Marinobacter iranensis TaxID=2962607 RepID=A0ABT5YAR3_9GAMM|nr:DUF4398 domain-containing protein [Marinobacter iranensis]MDF0750766.1 DUF4398 domain-containing protein [Marinobacter iranensis]
MMLIPFPTPNPLRLLLLAVLASGLLVTGCASSPSAPTSSLNEARSAVVSAEQYDAGRFAAAELGEARQKLDQANTAVKEERMAKAEQLALEARVGAELAYAKTEAAKAEAINAEMQRGAEALTDEMNRTGAQQ